MSPIALWMLLGAPAPMPLPTEAPTVAEALQAPPPESPPAPFLRPGVRVVAGGPGADEEPPPERPPLP